MFQNEKVSAMKVETSRIDYIKVSNEIAHSIVFMTNKIQFVP